MRNIVNEDDFKYYMQDIERHYFGGRYNYLELLDNEMVPFKFKSIITKYLKEQVGLETTLESHIYYLEKDTFDYEIYKQLRCRVRVSQYKDPNKRDKGFKEKLYSITEFVSIPKEEKEEMGIIVRELVISKLALFGFSV
ncbi:hypothetical protein [Butyrivibrio sp. AE2032]|uniref:hypothetical protein n=1 Tax=Butyrivibrio sp. AE2032 TaxID=1458463 RepID=UPI00054D82DE|nr:hypothetical protein [Butyrivibrio sp. AE2032]